MSFLKYSKFLLFFIGSFLAVIATFNIVVDPMDLYGIVNRPGFNDIKPDLEFNLRLHKVYKVARLRPTHVIMGSSRALLGLDPITYEKFSKEAGPFYNLAVHTPKIETTRGLLAHAVHLAPIEEVVLGLDFFMFNAHLPSGEHGKKIEDRLITEGGIFPLKGFVSDFYSSLFSKYFIEKSFHVLRATPEKIAILGDGSWNPAQYKIRPGVHNEKFRKEIKQYIDSWYFNSGKGFSYYRNGYDSFSEFKNLLTFLRKNNIRVKIFFSPFHAVQFHIFNELGYLDAFWDWKKRVCEIFEEVYQSDSGSLVWDFSGLNQITTEGLPKSNRDYMKYYMEHSHYKKATGEMILGCLMGNRDYCFGSRATASGMDRLRLEFNAGYPAYKAETADWYAFVKDYAKDFKLDQKITIR